LDLVKNTIDLVVFFFYEISSHSNCIWWMGVGLAPGWSVVLNEKKSSEKSQKNKLGQTLFFTRSNTLAWQSPRPLALTLMGAQAERFIIFSPLWDLSFPLESWFSPWDQIWLGPKIPPFRDPNKSHSRYLREKVKCKTNLQIYTVIKQI
jgi:hypothetical protein